MRTPTFTLSKDLVLPASAVTQKIAFLGRTGSGKSHAAQKLAEEMLTGGAQIVVLDPGGDWYGLRLKSDGTPSGFDLPVFGGFHGDLPLEPGAGKLIADLIVDRGISCVCDVSLMRKGERKQFATDFAEQLFHRAKTYRQPVHLFIEEAQMFIPQVVRAEEARMLGAYEDIVKLGRKVGLGTSVISQRPQSLNKDGLNQAEVLICFQLTGPHERKAIEAWVHDKGAEEDMIADLPKLQVGNAIVWSPSWLQVFKRVRIEAKKTFDAGGTPVLGAKKIQPRELAPIDLEEIRQAMAEVVHRTEENDPKKLKERIKQLESKQGAGKPVVAAALEQEVARLKKELKVREDEWQAHVRTVQKATEASNRLHDILTSARTEHVIKPRENGASEAPRFQKTKKELAAYETPKTKLIEDRTIRDLETGGLLAGSRRMLQVLAVWKPWTLSRKQVATLSGMSRSGTFNTYLSKLRTMGYIEERGSDIMATNAGVKALAGDIPPAPTTAELLEVWIPKLGGAGAARMLRVLVEQHPKSLSRTELASRCGLTRSGTFNTYLSKLRTCGLLNEGQRGYVKAAEVLFISPGGSNGAQEAQQ